MSEKWMHIALKEAEKANQKQEVPIGAVITLGDQLIAKAHNQTISKQDACAHAEILCIQKACRKLNNHRLVNTCLYVTLEPCMMCYGAIIQARIPMVYFGASDKRTGVFSQDKLSRYLNTNHHPDHQGGLLNTPCEQILHTFFQSKR